MGSVIPITVTLSPAASSNSCSPSGDPLNPLARQSTIRIVQQASPRNEQLALVVVVCSALFVVRFRLVTTIIVIVLKVLRESRDLLFGHSSWFRIFAQEVPQ